jgi:S1-C subfamily serine protease
VTPCGDQKAPDKLHYGTPIQFHALHYLDAIGQMAEGTVQHLVAAIVASDARRDGVTLDAAALAAEYRPTRSSRAVLVPKAIAGVLTRPAHTAAAGGRVAYIRHRCSAAPVEGRIFPAGVYHGVPADRAGLLVGDEIVAAHGAPFDPIGSLADKQQRRP